MIIENVGYLVEPNNQIVLPNGSPNVAGIVRVYNAGTDDIAKTYCDFNGTRNPADIRLDNNGRAIIIADVTKAYRVEVRDSNGGLLWTVEPAYCIGGEGGGTPVADLVPLVRVKFQNGAWSKISGDDGFIKPNPWGVDSLYLPESSWWLFNVTLSLRNPTPRDLIQQIQLAWDWNGYISMDVPPATYAATLPAMQFDYDFTGQFTRQTSRSTLYEKDNRTNDWLTVAVQAYQDTLPNDLEAVVGIDIFKVRDA